MGRKLGDRKDGALLRDIDSMHFVMPLMYPNRCDNEAYISERIDLTNINKYLEKKNAGNPDYEYNLFQVMVTAVLKTITLRPKMNRFIANQAMYFKGRAKRMIVTSGYNVYPGQLENILDAHEAVQMSCVIGVPDPYKMQKVKAFVKLAPGVEANDATKKLLMDYCSKHIAKYAMPYDIEFKEDMPKTLVGKVAYRVLEEEELSKLNAQK